MTYSLFKKWLCFIFIAAFLLSVKNIKGQTINTIAGGFGDSYGAATCGRLFDPQAVAVDGSGNLYIAENSGTGGISRFLKVSNSGILTNIAGNGITDGCNGFGRLATDAQTARPEGIIVGASGNLFLAYSAYIAEVNTAGILSVFAGNGTQGYSGDGSLASTAELSNTYGMAMDIAGNVYVADWNNNRIRKINTAGIISTVAGGGTSTADGVPAITASLSHPTGVAVDNAGNIYIADYNHRLVRKVNTSGIISTVAGNGAMSGYTAGVAATATSIGNPYDIKVDAAGNLYISNGNVLKVNTSGIITTFAGTTAGFSGDGGPATAAQLNGTTGIALDGSGNMFIADAGNNCIRKVNTSGIISTVAGNQLNYSGFFGDGGSAQLAGFGACCGAGSLLTPYGLQPYVTGVLEDKKGNIYVADPDNQRIRKIDTAGIITTIAGNGTTGFSGDGGPASAAQLDVPTGIACDMVGNLYFSDFGSHHIREIDTLGIIHTLAGGGTSGLGDGGPATAAVISAIGLSLDSLGNIYIVDIDSQRIRKVNASTGIISTIAGNGIAGFSGDSGPATNAELDDPIGVAVDKKGNVYIADYLNSRIRKVDTFGNITSYAGNGSYGGTSEIGLGDGGPAVMANMYFPTGITTDKFGNVLFSDRGTDVDNSYDSFSSGYSRVREIDQYGYIHTVAGNGIQGYSGDNGLVITAELYHPWGISIDTSGHLFIADNDNYAVRKVCCLTNPTDHPPLFTGGSLQSFSICSGSSATSINSIMTISDADVGDHEKWIVYQPPGYGTLAGFPDSAISTGGTIVPTGLTYTPSTGYSGNDTFIIRISDGTYYTPTTIVVTINPLPVGGVISGATSVCVSSTITLTDTITSGIWSCSNSHVTVGSATGVVTGISGGIDTIRYTVTNSCGISATTHIITVNSLPSVATITGLSTVCVSSSISLSDATTGGAWSCSDPYVAIGILTGSVAGIAPGVATVSYTVTNSCGSSFAAKTITVNPIPSAGTITGTTSLCSGGTSTLTDTTPGGTWSSGSSLVATIGSSSGLVTGIDAGSAVISYSLTGIGCGSAIAITIVNVTPATPISPITGLSAVCIGSTISLSDASPGGTWSSSNPSVATVGSTGIVTGISAGVTAISYTASLGCGISVATTDITVNSSPSSGTISGTPTLCTGATGILSSYVPGGVWSSSNGTVTVSPTGLITGVTPGTDTISYSVTNSCGSATVTHIINVYPAPTAGTITGSTSVCAGAAVTLSDTTTGGVWSSGNTAIATVGSTGVVTGITGGVTTISYTATTGCGTMSAIKTITVNAPYAGIITGVTSLCASSTTTLTDAVSGGTWSSSNISVATVGSSGSVTAIAGGTTIISYTVSSSCGTATATTIFTTGTLPEVSPITGVADICAGTTTTLSDVTLYGIWSSSNTSVATISTAGVVTGVAAGTTTISYIVTAGCGTDGVTFTMTVDTAPAAGTISGSALLCMGATITLGESTVGGTWSSSNPSVATVVTGTGLVTGIGSGNVTVTYTASNICGVTYTTKTMTVNPLPEADVISGASNVCAGAVTTLSDASPGGVWSSSNISIAAAGSATGIITGVAVGSTLISYTVTNSCGSATALHTIVINPLPYAGYITGATSVCTGVTITLSDTAASGVWSSSSPTVAGISSIGVVTGVSTGMDVILYTVTNLCGTATATKTITVNAVSAGVITGITTLCAGGTTTLTDATSGGTWSSSNPAVATIGSTGAVTAISDGASIISYSVTGACGSATATTTFTVGTLPSVSSIAGTTTICAGTTTTLTDATLGGVWSSSTTSVATIGSTGVVTGISDGTTIISYLVTGGCGTAGSTAIVHVETMPSAGSIWGITSLCEGATTSLSESVSGGDWSSSNPSVASISTSGVITGITTGMVTISYSVANSCGTVAASAIDTVKSVALPGIITGSTYICQEATATLSDTISGGTWSSSAPTIAAIGSTGIVTGITTGTTTISYTVINSCGASSATEPITINPLPYILPITGTTSIVAGGTATLSDPVAGGYWNSSDSAIATVDPAGIITGISVGTATITYTLINSFDCTSDTTITITVTLPTLVNNPDVNNGYNLYPNPANNELTIVWKNQYAPKAEVVLTDVAGREILKKIIETQSANGNTMLSLNGIANGVYLITIQSSSGYYTGKLVVNE